MKWICWHVGTAADPKLGNIAKCCGASRSNVVTVWALLLEIAYEAEIQGDISCANVEDIGFLFDIDSAVVSAILDEMNRRGMIKDHKISKWEKRQHKKSTERVRQFRKRNETLETLHAVSGTEETSTGHNKTGHNKTEHDKTEHHISEEASSLRSGEAATHDEALRLWNVVAERMRLSIAQCLTAQRTKKLRQRLTELGGINGWIAMLEKLEASKFLTGRAPGTGGRDPFRANFDFVLQAGSLQKLMEGRYDDTPAVTKPHRNQGHDDPAIRAADLAGTLAALGIDVPGDRGVDPG
jgi:DNA-binding MarR family transcriptional regulator